MKGLPFLALAMAAFAGLLLGASRWLYASGTVEPGDDTPFDLLLAVPAVLVVGTALAALSRARGWGPHGAANAALAVNGGLLALLVALALVGIASFTGR